MRGITAKVLQLALVFISACLLVFAIMNLREIRKTNQSDVYRLYHPVSKDMVERIFEENLLARIVFIEKSENEIVEDTELNRTAQADILKLCGSSAVLYPQSYPLDLTDKKGCLLGEETAWALFGSPDPVGAQITYEGKCYEIHGILKNENVLVVEDAGLKEYNYFAAAGEDYAARRRTAAEVQNAYSLYFEELPLRFQEKEAKLLVFLAALFLYVSSGLFLCRGISEERGDFESRIFSESREISESRGFSGSCGIFESHGIPGRRLKKLIWCIGIIGTLAGCIYVLSFSAYSLPDRVSDLDWWADYFRGEWEGWKLYWRMKL